MDIEGPPATDSNNTTEGTSKSTNDDSTDNGTTSKGETANTETAPSTDGEKAPDTKVLLLCCVAVYLLYLGE